MTTDQTTNNMKRLLEQEYKRGRAEALADEIEFLEFINNGASYTWICSKIDERLKKLKEMKK